MLYLTIGDRTLIYSLKSRKLGRNGYRLCRDTYIYEDKNTQKLIQKKKSKMSKEPFLKSHFQLSHWQFMQKSFSLLLRRLINNKIKKKKPTDFIHAFIFKTSHRCEDHKIQYMQKKALPVQGSIRPVSSKYCFLIFLFICATAIKKVRNATLVTVFIKQLITNKTICKSWIKVSYRISDHPGVNKSSPASLAGDQLNNYWHWSQIYSGNI